MIITVKVHAGAKRNFIKQEKDIYKVHLTTCPEKGKANKHLIKLLADFFKIKKSSISIIHGQRSQNKTILIDKQTKNCYHHKIAPEIKLPHYQDNNKKYLSKTHCWER